MMKLLKLLGLAGIATLSTQSVQAQCIIDRLEIQDSTKCDSFPHNISAVAYSQQGTLLGQGLSYRWSTGDTIHGYLYNAVVGNTYSVTVTDANGCSLTNTTTITQLPRQSVTLSLVQDACNTTGGVANSLVTGGTPPYMYEWSNGMTTANASGLLGGQQYLRVTDSSGCDAYGYINIAGAGQYTSTYARASSCNQNNGVVYVFSQSAQTYLWTNGATTSTISGLASGWYGLTITDSISRCSVTQQYHVGYDPNCETVINGRAWNVSSTGVCSGGVPLAYDFIQIRNVQNNTSTYVMTNANGEYEYRTRTAGVYEIQSDFRQGLTGLCPTNNLYSVTTTPTGAVITNQDFYAAYPNGIDAQLDIWSAGARPGGTAFLNTSYCNYGSQPITNGTINIFYDQTISLASVYSALDFPTTGLSATFMGDDTTLNMLTFTYSLSSGGCGHIWTTYHVPTTAQLGDVLYFAGLMSPVVNDIDPTNNVDTTMTTVVNSYDPNDKRAYPFRAGDEWNGQIFASDTQMEYIIRFQNTGNAPAIRVAVHDTLEPNLLPETIRDVKMSHNGTLRIVGNALAFEFNNIYLADSVHNEPESHGYIKFTIDRNPNLQLGSVVSNSAAIYFDFNAPVITNTATSTLFEILAVAETDAAAINLRAMPNPFDKQISVQLELQNESPVRISMINALGQTVRSVANNRTQTAGVHQYQIEADDLASGMYWILVETNTGRYAHKIVKQ